MARSRPFQFPSNGKAHVNSVTVSDDDEVTFVSIPFKREGTCELTPPKLWTPPAEEEGFNSLQTGRHM